MSHRIRHQAPYQSPPKNEPRECLGIGTMAFIITGKRNPRTYNLTPTANP